MDAKYCGQPVCLFVCLLTYFKTTRPLTRTGSMLDDGVAMSVSPIGPAGVVRFSVPIIASPNVSLRVTCGRGSVSSDGNAICYVFPVL